MKEFATTIGIFVIVLVLGTIIAIYNAFVVLKIASHYDIEMVTALGFRIVFGLILIKNLLLYKSDKSEWDDLDDSEKVRDVFVKVFTMAFVISFAWFVSWMMSFIIT